MTFEEAQAMYELYCINPELTCTCDELHVCQQCMEEEHPKADDCFSGWDNGNNTDSKPNLAEDTIDEV